MIDKPPSQLVKRGWGKLPCPKCGDDEVTVSIDLDDMSNAESCQCRTCQVTFGLSTIRGLIARWKPVLEWLETAPEIGK